VTISSSGGGKFRFSVPTSSDWRLVWSDEFNGADGSLPDKTKWTYDIGGNGWGNHELEYYTDRPANAEIRNGSLLITARKEKFTGADGVTREYTSARLKTQTLFAQTYGRFEARIKIPAGEGMWPAFWILGDDISKIGWPKCGEIDIMENIGKEPSTVPAGASPTIFIFTPSSGSPPPSASTWILRSTLRSRPTSGPPDKNGFSIIPFSSS